MVYDRYTEKAVNKAIQHFERKKKELEVRQTKPALIKLRNSFIENQKRHNYNAEYERLIGVLTNKAITHSGNTAQLESRIKHLETLGSKAVTGIDPKKRQTYDEIMSQVKNS
jgi:hypothetical protein